MNIGVIGLGMMGCAMARNLLRAGHRLTVYNRSASLFRSCRQSPANRGKKLTLQSYLFIGGDHDGLNYPAHTDEETIQWPVAVTGREIYNRSTLSVGDVSITIYIHESLAPEQALNRLVEHHQARCVNMPGGRC